MIQRIKEFIGGLLARSDLDALDPHEVNEIARDMGVTAEDLYRLDRVSSHTTLMPKRLSLEGVDPAIVQAEFGSWSEVRDLVANISSASAFYRNAFRKTRQESYCR